MCAYMKVYLFSLVLALFFEYCFFLCSQYSALYSESIIIKPLINTNQTTVIGTVLCCPAQKPTKINLLTFQATTACHLATERINADALTDLVRGPGRLTSLSRDPCVV